MVNSDMFLHGTDGERVEIRLLSKQKTPLLILTETKGGEFTIFFDSIEQVEMVGSAIARFLKTKNEIKMELVKEDEADGTFPRYYRLLSSCR